MEAQFLEGDHELGLVILFLPALFCCFQSLVSLGLHDNDPSLSWEKKWAFATDFLNVLKSFPRFTSLSFTPAFRLFLLSVSGFSCILLAPAFSSLGCTGISLFLFCVYMWICLSLGHLDSKNTALLF
ncbi:hypothetical protein BDZ91DRAFT_109155 [Kalaharituber pfeilii]|nr:hypothetical protein BDZ91DRAFT_109155 [Kalaharituber pfeilii]